MAGCRVRGRRTGQLDGEGPLHQRVCENYEIQRAAYTKNLEPTFNAIRDAVADLSVDR